MAVFLMTEHIKLTQTDRKKAFHEKWEISRIISEQREDEHGGQ